MSRVVVIGAGAWGCTFAQVAALAGSDVTLVCHTAAQAGTLGATRHDARHLGDIARPQSVHVTHVDDPAWATQLRFLEGSLRERLLEVTGAVIERIEVRVARPGGQAAERRSKNTKNTST